MEEKSGDRVFKETSPMLLGLAYRILGSRADAEDAVQDTFLRWQEAGKDGIENPAAWLRTVCTRRCLDILKSANKARVDYVGAWLPEPVHTPVDPGAGADWSLASSLTTAFLLMLERLTPKERAAYLLHEIFEAPYAEIADALKIKENTCRKLVSRAQAHIGHAKARHVTPIDKQDCLFAAFEAAIASGATGQLAALLSDDIALTADGGGKAPAVLETLHGKAEVLTFVAQNLRRYWEDYRRIGADLNGGRGLIVMGQDAAVASVSFAYDEDGRATHIFIMRNPDKLAQLRAGAIH